MPKHVTTTRRPKALEQNLDVIVLSSAMGYRMKSYGPRCLMKLRNDETVLDRQLSVINTVYARARSVVTIGFEADKVAKAYTGQISLIEHQYHHQNNEGDAARLGINNSVADHILIICGHVLFNQNTLRSIDLNLSGVVIDSHKHLSDTSIMVNHDSNRVTNIVYGKEFKDRWSQIVYLTGNELELFRQIVQKEQCNRHFLHEIVNAVMNEGGVMQAYDHPDSQVAVIDSYVDYLEIQKKEYNYI